MALFTNDYGHCPLLMKNLLDYELVKLFIGVFVVAGGTKINCHNYPVRHFKVHPITVKKTLSAFFTLVVVHHFLLNSLAISTKSLSAKLTAWARLRTISTSTFRGNFSNASFNSFILYHPFYTFDSKHQSAVFKKNP